MQRTSGIPISIHPPRAGRDEIAFGNKIKLYPFQSTLPVRGGTCWRCLIVSKRLKFQSTLPVRGGTSPPFLPSQLYYNFNPPSPCGEGQSAGRQSLRVRNFNPPSPCGEGHILQSIVGTSAISIHPPRAGRDSNNHQKTLLNVLLKW